MLVIFNMSLILYIFFTGTALCPVASFEKYLDKRHPGCEAFFQRPRQSVTPGGSGSGEHSSSWYERKPLGKNSLGSMMSMISKAAQLSLVYTNHSVRATSITQLSNAGFEARHIKTVSGHRNEASIASYCSDTSAKQKQDMSTALSVSCGILPAPVQSPCEGTAAVVPDPVYPRSALQPLVAALPPQNSVNTAVSNIPNFLLQLGGMNFATPDGGSNIPMIPDDDIDNVIANMDPQLFGGHAKPVMNITNSTINIYYK